MALTKTVLKSRLEQAVTSANLGSKIWCGQTFNDVFSGEILINTLLDDSENFTSRDLAIECAQSMLDTKLITCITKRRKFDDGDRLYCINRKELEKAISDDPSNTVRATPKAKPVNSSNLNSVQIKKDPLGRRSSQEKTNDSNSHQKSNHVTTQAKTNQANGLRPMNLQRLLEKDVTHINKRGNSSSSDPKPCSAKGNLSDVLKDKRNESANEKNLTTNKLHVVLSEQDIDKSKQRTAVILLEEGNALPNEKESLRNGENSKALTTPDNAKLNIESKAKADKQKVKKSLSPSLTALIEKDAKNSQSYKQKEGKKVVDMNGTSSPKMSTDVTAESEQLSNSWEAFELKLQNKVKKSDIASSPNVRGSPDMRGSPDIRGSPDTSESLSKDVKTDATDSGNEQERIVRTLSSEKRNSKDGKSTLSEMIGAGKTSGAISQSLSQQKADETAKRKSSNEDLQVKLSVNGDELAIPSLRARKNSFLGSDENTGSHSGKTTRERGPSFSLNDDSKTVIIEDAIQDSKTGNKTSGNKERIPSFRLTDEQNTVIIENDNVSNNLHEKETSVSRTASQSSTGSRISILSDGKNHRVSSLSREASLENTESKSQTSLLGKPGVERSWSNGSKSETNGQTSEALPKTLADLLARDKTSSEQSSTDSANVYKDKLKELKKTNPYHSGAPIKLGVRAQSSNIEEKTNSPEVKNSPDTGLDETDASQSNHIDSKIAPQAKQPSQSLASNTKVFKTSSIESGTSPTSTALGTKPGHEKSSPNYVIPHLNFKNQKPYDMSPSSPKAPTRPSSLNVAPSPLVNGEMSASEMHEELERRLVEFEANKRSYENKITELQLQVDYLRRQRNGQLDDMESSVSISDITSLYSPYSTPIVSPGNSTVNSPSLTPQTTPRSSVFENVLSPKSPVPPPPPAPPAIPAPPLVPENHVKPTKPVVNPKTEMKPLFWNRIIASNDSMIKSKCVWKSIKEAPIDANEFEKLFSKRIADRKLKRTKSLRDDKHFAHINGKKVAKLLETNRSRAIGIKMSSLNCQLEDIRNAVYNMDTSVVDMESLQSIYDIYPKEEEIQIIEEHLRKVPAVPLDKPEEFMNQLTKMKHFKERLECWLFQDKFSEITYGIERSLACVTESSNVITTNSEISTLLSLVLAYGNYMNGNTQRGQADGFQLDVLLKLRDVKAKSSDMNLLQYTVKQYLKQHERGLDKSKGETRLPSPVTLSNAAQVSFDKLKEEMIKISLLLDETDVQVKKILNECSPAQRNPFEEKMRKFQATAKQKIAEQKERMAKAELAFFDAVEYFRWESDGKKETPQEFFGLWAKFIDEVKTCVKLEKQQQQIAKKNFSKVEHLNQIREAATKFKKRRQSVDIII